MECGPRLGQNVTFQALSGPAIKFPVSHKNVRQPLLRDGKLSERRRFLWIWDFVWHFHKSLKIANSSHPISESLGGPKSIYVQ